MPFGYPVFLELRGRRCVVIGETAIREGKVRGLLAAGADDVVVVSEGPASRLDALADDARVSVARRPWRETDLDGAFVCVASSRDADERARIAVACRARGVLVNVMDDVPNCDWATPSVVRRGELVFAISTGGASPALARKLREELSERFPDEWEGIVSTLRRVREETLPLLPDLGERARRWHAALDLDEAVELIRAGRAEDLRERLRRRLLAPEAVPA
jgi:precorrin-2 dehydrogenase